MSVTARTTLSNRAFGFLSSLAIHAGLGLTLLAWSQSGPTGASPANGEGEHVLVMDLIPLPDGEMDAQADQHAKAQVEAGQSGKKQFAQKMPQPSSSGVIEGGGKGSGNGLADAGEGVSDASSAASGAPKLSGSDIQLFKTTLLRHIERFRRYPAQARQDGIEGLARVHFVMTGKGDVTDIWIETTSGARVLDDEAVDAVLRARPLPIPPDDWPQSFDVTLPIGYSLQ